MFEVARPGRLHRRVATVCEMGPVYRRAVPNAMTIGGLMLGMRAITYAFHGQLVPSAYMIGFAGVVDALDGAAARLLNAQSSFGKYLDTLSTR